MYCSSLNINLIPACLDTDGEVILAGIYVEDHPSETINVKLTNQATGKEVIFECTTDGSDEITDLDIATAYDLMDHRYSLEFFDTDFNRLPVTIEGSDGILVTSHLLYFNTIQQPFTGTINVKEAE